MLEYSIADFLADGNPPRALNGQMRTNAADVLGEAIRDVIRVRADAPAAWYYLEPEKVDWRFDSPVFGPTRMPYPQMWIEWSAPDIYYAEGAPRANPVKSAAAAVEELTKDDFLATFDSMPQDFRRNLEKEFLWSSHVIVFQLFAKFRANQRDVTEFGRVALGTDDAGARKSFVQLPQKIHNEGLSDAMVIDMGFELVRPAIIAIGLMNCKNVSVSPSTTPMTSTRKQRKRDLVPKLSFNTIKLPLPASAARADKQAVTLNVMPLHMVRGHFKTFTADAPLMGRAVGTYWWGWQSRGKRANGIVKKDYEVDRG